jgi:hypothetical protein
MRTRILAVFLFAALRVHAEPALRILFIGNSLTYTNDLPSMVGRIAAADGPRRTQNRGVEMKLTNAQLGMLMGVAGGNSTQRESRPSP